MVKLMRAIERILPSSNAAEGKIGSIEFNLWMAQMVGLPLMGLKPETGLQKICIAIFGGFVQIALFLYVFYLELYNLYLNFQDLDKLTQNIPLSLTHVVYGYKVFNTYYNYGNLKDIIQKLSAITRICVLSQKQMETFQNSEIKSKIVLLIYFNIALSPGVLSVVYILIAPDEFADNSFPYTAEMPNFMPPIMQNLYKSLAISIIALAITTIDNLNILLMSQICMHLKVLNLAFDELHQSSNQELKVDPYIWLVSIVKYHSELIVLRQQVERIYNLPVMAQFISSMLILAMVTFQIIVGDGSKSSIIMDLLLCCVLCQLFLYCWFGNEVYEQSKTLSTSGFGCSWYQFDKKCKQTLLIFMTNAERPFLFTAGSFMALTLPSFTFIISKSYSIVAVLRQMYTRS